MTDMVDSKKQMLKTEDIIQKSAMNTRAPFPYPEFYKSIQKELNVPGTQFIRQGNTLFLIHYDHGRVGSFRALNADTATNYLESSRIFINAMYNLGYDVLITQFYDPSINNIFKAISRNPPREQMGYKTEKTNKGFKGTISLGPKRGGSI